MNVPAPTPVSASLGINSDGKGGLQYVWTGANVDSSGNFNLTSIKGPIQMTIAISSSLQVLFCTPAVTSLYLGKASSGEPTGPYVGNEFTAPSFVNNNSGVLSWNDQNSDGVTYAYVLWIWLVNTQYPNGTRIKIDPRIVNRGTSK
jgi:hypothetical protein